MNYYINNNNYDELTLRKMSFIYNAINDGWNVEKLQNIDTEESKYIFKKKHENKKEIFSNNYLEKFIKNNLK